MRLPTLLTALLLAGTVHGLDPAVAYARAIEATWAGILSKQRMLTEYTRVWEKGWGQANRQPGEDAYEGCHTPASDDAIVGGARRGVEECGTWGGTGDAGIRRGAD